MRKGTCFWLGILTGIIISLVSFTNSEEIESNGDLKAKLEAEVSERGS